MDHLIDPGLAQQLEWDAQKVFRFKEGKYVQIFTEPWTGRRFWDVQVCRPIFFVYKLPDTDISKTSLPNNAKLICIELYADKSKLSTFGTEKGYPVMARILNLPVKIRNGKGVGGAHVVGWLPVVRLK